MFCKKKLPCKHFWPFYNFPGLQVKRAFVNLVLMIDLAGLSAFTRGPICGLVHT